MVKQHHEHMQLVQKQHLVSQGMWEASKTIGPYSISCSYRRCSIMDGFELCLGFCYLISIHHTLRCTLWDDYLRQGSCFSCSCSSFKCSCKICFGVCYIFGVLHGLWGALWKDDLRYLISLCCSSSSSICCSMLCFGSGHFLSIRDRFWCY